MKQLLSILALVCFGLPQVCAQNSPVNIPDDNFLQALIQMGVDINGDEKISHSEAEAVTTLNLEAEGISDLTGIEAFINLDTLNCSNTDLQEIDLSSNTLLKSIDCSGPVDKRTGVGSWLPGPLAMIDISNNKQLYEIHCDRQSITSLDLSVCTLLRRISLKANPYLEEVRVWTLPFPPDGVELDTTASPNVYFK